MGVAEALVAVEAPGAEQGQGGGVWLWGPTGNSRGEGLRGGLICSHGNGRRGGEGPAGAGCWNRKQATRYGLTGQACVYVI